MIKLYPKEYIEYLVHFHGSRDYFECHEILEDYWKKSDGTNKESIWVGFIQLAVTSYHHRRNNFAGAEKTLKNAQKIFSDKKKSLKSLGISPVALFDLLEHQASTIENRKAYESLQLPIEDPKLIIECQHRAEQLGFVWGDISDMNNNNLVHRHILRDRSEVLQNRKLAIAQRRGSD